MRIIAGRYGGRRLIVPKNRDIRPTSDKIRGAVFNALRSLGAVEGAAVLDAFCGTGALGLEALSQGAHSCIFMDKSRDSIALARANAAALGVGGEALFLLKDALKPGAQPDPVSLVFLDPPYRQGLAFRVLLSLESQGWLGPGAVIVMETEREFSEPVPGAFSVHSKKSYGETKITIMKRSG